MSPQDDLPTYEPTTSSNNEFEVNYCKTKPVNS